MRNMVKNETGYTILIVLLIIVVIGLVAPPLISNVMSSSLQNKKTEEKVQLENLVDMGKHYFRNEVREKITSQDMKTSATPTEIKTKLTSIHNAVPINLSTDKDTLKYMAGYDSIEYEKGYIIINYVSKAMFNSSELEEREQYRLQYTGTLVIGDETDEPEDPDLPTTGQGCLDLHKKNGKIHLSGKKQCTLDGSFVIAEPLKITGQARLEVTGSVVFKNIVDVTGKGTLNIAGDGRFNNDVTVRGHGIINIQGSGTFDKGTEIKGFGTITVK